MDMTIKDKCDFVGKPNKFSNLRLIKFFKADNESIAEEKFRVEKEKVQQWNQEFWAKHNQQFLTEKQNFRKLNIKDDDPMASDKMSVFYKQFLDKNWKVHFDYNKQWYKKNAYLVSLALKVKTYNFLKRLKLR